MELGLRLGNAPSPFQKPRPPPSVPPPGLDFCLGFSSICRVEEQQHQPDEEIRQGLDRNSAADFDIPPLQFDLLHRAPIVRHYSARRSSETDVSEHSGSFSVRSTDEIGRAAVSTGCGGRFFAAENAVGGMEVDDNGGERACSRGSDEEDLQNIGSNSRKKLRLSREQSAFLEESFKEHHTLYPKQKLELAKRLNLRPRQVEVWFQNRRARTKLKQTEVDCEYLKKCCETLTQENRKLQKELQDLRALKTTDSFYMHLPATTLTMCASCERATAAAATECSGKEPVSKPSSYSFAIPTTSYLFPPARDYTK